MKVVITGGAGFIGSHIAEYFSSRGDSVTVFDNLRTGNIKNIENLGVTFVNGDVRDRSLLKDVLHETELVFHLAAMVSVPESLEKPEECIDINCLGLLNVLKESVNAGVRKLCFSSSSAIYGDNPSSPKVETMIPEPKTPYAVTKLDGEYYCDIYSKNSPLKTVSLRYFNVFGPRQNPKSQYAAAVPIFTSNAVANIPIKVFGDGEQTRDFIYVKDVVAANVFMAMNNFTGVYNVGYGTNITINKLIEKIRIKTATNSKVNYLPERAGDVKHSMADVSKLKNAGFKAVSSFEEGLNNTIFYFMH